MEWNYMQLEVKFDLIQFRFIWIQVNSKIGLKLNLIEFKFNWKEMGCKLVEILLKIYSWI
jgi:hypothetical protein